MSTRLKKGILIFLLKLLFLIIVIPAKSQELKLRFEHLTLKNGLSQVTVSGIVQDKYGFMWFSTQDGLNRYDGYDFKIFKHDPLDSLSISDSYLNKMIKDSDGNIWIGTELGLNRYDFLYDRFVSYKHDTNDQNSLDHNAVYEIFESISIPGLLWIGTLKGLNSFDTKNNKFTRYPLNFSDSLNQSSELITSIYEAPTKPGILWIGTTYGLYSYQYNNGELKKHRVQSGLNDFKSIRISDIYEDSHNVLWIGTKSGLFQLNRQTQQFEICKKLAKSSIIRIYEDNHSNFWVSASGEGLILYKRESEQVIKYTHNPSDPLSIGSNEIADIFEGKSGILWFGFFGNGIGKTNLNTEQIIHYYHIPNNPNSILDNTVRSILEDNAGLIWIGTDGGLSCFDRETGKYKHYKNNPSNLNSLSENAIRSIIQDKKGIFWIGTRYGGLNRFDLDSNSFRHFKKDQNRPGSIGSDNVRVILEDENGVLWIGSVGGGLSKFNPETEQFKNYMYQPETPNCINDNRVYSIIRAKNGLLWVATGNGIASFDRDKEKFTKYFANPKDSASLSYHLIMTVFEDHSGFIWAGSYGGGLNRLDPKTGVFKRFTEKQGLSNNVVYGIIEDKKSNLWISTNKGISKFNPLTNEFKKYDTDDGLQDIEFNAGAYFLGKNNEFFFGGINGFNVFNPDSLKNNEFLPPIVITDFQLFYKSVRVNQSVNNRIILTKSILETDKILLSHKERIFSFSFAALDFLNAEKNEYTYKLEGLDLEWNRIGNRRFVNYTSLSAGEYIFRVMGTNSDGVWNEQGASIKIIIKPPWWKTPLFLIIISVAAIILTFLYIKIREKNLRLEKLHLEKLVEKRTSDLLQANNQLIDKKTDLETKQNILVEQTKQLDSLNSELSKINTTKDKFFSIIAHDLKTPFNTVLGFAELLIKNVKKSKVDLEKILKYSEFIYDSSKTAYSLLENLLLWSRSQRGLIECNPEKLNLENLVEFNVKLLINTALEKNVSLLSKVNKKLNVLADREMVLTIIRNLISNAIKFTHPNGKITIAAKTEKKYVIVSISDSGVGISPVNIDKLFRVDKNISTEGTKGEQGTGLGLILCKEFIEANKGEIWVESKLNVGTTFSFSLPQFIK